MTPDDNQRYRVSGSASGRPAGGAPLPVPAMVAVPRRARLQEGLPQPAGPGPQLAEGVWRRTHRGPLPVSPPCLTFLETCAVLLRPPSRLPHLGGGAFERQGSGGVLDAYLIKSPLLYFNENFPQIFILEVAVWPLLTARPPPPEGAVFVGSPPLFTFLVSCLCLLPVREQERRRSERHVLCLHHDPGDDPTPQRS